MSLLSPEQIRISLGASYAALGRVRGGQVLQWRMQRCSGTGATPWQEALGTVAGWLAEMKPRKARITALLSAELAPLCLLPWRDDLARPEQQAMLAQAQLRRIHGEAALHWKTLAQPLGFGEPWLASGIDQRLLQALEGGLGGCSVHSVQPLALSLFNRWQAGSKTRHAWLLVPEPERLTALHLRDGRLCLAQTLPVKALQTEPLAAILQREIRLAGLSDLTAPAYAASRSVAETNYADMGWRADAAISREPLHLLGGRA